VEAAARELEGFKRCKRFKGLTPGKRQVATLEQQKLTATGLGGSLGQCEGHGRDKAGSTPPVVPGAAPALAKAGSVDYLCILV
jgi:hypothetical protein